MQRDRTKTQIIKKTKKNLPYQGRTDSGGTAQVKQLEKVEKEIATKILEIVTDEMTFPEQLILDALTAMSP